MIKIIGNHRIRCGDIHDNLDELYGENRIDVFYSDPPWGNLEYWQTLNNKMTGAEKKKTDLVKFLNRIFDVAIEYTKKESPIFIEYGVKYNNQLIEIANSKGLVLEHSIECLYSSPPRPMVLNIFSKNGNLGLSNNYVQTVYHSHGYNLLLNALAPFSDKETITDPCCGLGYTARYAFEHGMAFYGNELNAARLERTERKLSVKK